ncbi:MAG: hypothetical protein P4L55_08145, partial [Syntrophobacteraceae bacterium]|nr:hypothetical protein [Syntrophobacteraceae bacterium]
EIDKLFAPAKRPGTSPAPSASAGAVAAPPAGRDSQPQKTAPAYTSEQIFNPAPLEIAMESEIDKPFAPSPDSDSFSELPAHIEQFNAAYLSLDWDFSRENLQKFIEALEQLEPMVSKSPDAKSVFKILEVILKRLLKRPNAINTKLVQLIRDSQGLLAHMLLREGESGPDEKQRLKALVAMFQNLRQRALAAKAGKTSPTPSAALPDIVAPASTGIAPQPDVSPSTVSAMPTSSSVETAALGVEAEVPARAATSVPSESARPAQSDARRENACLLMANGKWFALPASRVVKVVRSNRRTSRKVFTRGYATLADFKPLFRGINSGLLGQWAELDPEELNAYRFEPLETVPVDRHGARPMAVLVSDGKTNRIVFCDTLNFISDAEIADDSSADETLFFTIKSRLMIPFFDLGGLRSSSPEPPPLQGED